MVGMINTIKEILHVIGAVAFLILVLFVAFLLVTFYLESADDEWEHEENVPADTRHWWED